MSAVPGVSIHGRSLTTGSPHARLSEWLRDLSSLKDVAVGADIIVFRATIPTSGAITQPTSRQFKENLHYFLIEIRGGATPATDLDDIDEIRFNARDAKGNLFSSDIEFSSLVGPENGRPVPIRFSPGGLLIKPGTLLSGVFSRRATTITTARVAVATLVFLTVPVGFRG